MDIFFKPGFYFSASKGLCVYANGNDYTEDGTAPNRVQGEVLFPGLGLFTQPFFKSDLRPATKEEAEKMVYRFK